MTFNETSIGYSHTWTTGLSGIVSDFRLYDGAVLTLAEFEGERSTSLPHRTANLWAYYPLTSEPDKTIDFSGNARPLTASGPATLVTASSPPVPWSNTELISTRNAVAGGAISGTSAGSATVTGTITGAGAIAGTSAGAATITGTITGSGASVGAATGSATVTGTITGAGAIAGTSAGAATITGTITGSGASVGAATGSATVTGAITGAGVLAGTSAGAVTVAGAITGAGALAGTSIGAASITGTIAGSGASAGASAGSATVTGAIAGVGALAGTSAGASIVVGTTSGGTIAGAAALVDVPAFNAALADAAPFAAALVDVPAFNATIGSDMATYSILSLAQLSVTFTTVAGVPIDPTTVTIKVRDPLGTETSYLYGSSAVTKASTGIYQLLVSLTRAGLWYYRGDGTGACQATGENVLTVAPTQFQAP